MESGGKHGVMFPSQRPSTGPLAVVEGGAAAIAAYTCGLNPIAISSAGFRPPASWASPLVRNREVKVLHDADSAGRGAASRLADWALKGGASSVAIVDLYPELHHGEDIADLLRAVGREEAVAYLHRSIDQADVMENAPRSRGRPPSSIKQAEEYLRGVLSDGQWHSSKSVDENSPDEVSPRTLSRARRNLGVTSQQKNREWWLRIQPP
jgi:DNA primase